MHTYNIQIPRLSLCPEEDQSILVKMSAIFFNPFLAGTEELFTVHATASREAPAPLNPMSYVCTYNVRLQYLQPTFNSRELVISNKVLD